MYVNAYAFKDKCTDDILQKCINVLTKLIYNINEVCNMVQVQQ